MTEWKARRFWTQATVEEKDGGYEVLLDTRPVRTPSKSPLRLPTRAMAKAMAAEWDAQTEQIDPRTMPVTRAANTAIDKVTPQRAEIVALIAEYGDADLTCYRAASPDELIARQAAAWDPLLDWAADAFHARLFAVEGVMHAAQPPESLARLTEQVDAFDPFALTGFHDLVALSGSLIIGLAAAHRHATPEDLWQRSRIDETWQEEQWGVDEEAAAAAETKRTAFLDAHKFFEMSRLKS